MIARLTLLNRRLVVEAEAADVKALFRELGLMAETFEADSACGSCGSPELRPNCRAVDGFEYFSLKCSACSAELSLGQRKDGGLFAKRTDKDGRALEHGGWRKWQAGRAIEAAPAEPRRRQSS